ncbi:MAG: hypothetical protein LUD81_06640 [Clostridiales bacterium]|nr:hypothetical protein [Clostridiales bacterium]
MYPVIYKNKELFVISKLNENTLILAKDIKRQNKNNAVVFACGQNESRENKASARALKCSVINAVPDNIIMPFYNKKNYVHFILADPDEDKNLSEALKLTALYKNKTNIEIYTFNSTKESELLFDSTDKGKTDGLTVQPVKLRRVNIVRNQVYRYILNNSVFENAIEEYNEKIISVLIVGMGSYGMEMMKALIWCGQMDGYVLRFHIIDKRENIETLFYRECPGIRQRGTQPKSGEDYYEFNFYPETDVKTEKFIETVKNISGISTVFISLGNHQLNIEPAIDLRTVFSGMKIDAGLKPDHSRDALQLPHITAVVHSDEKAALLNKNLLSNYRHQYYCIDSIGAVSEMFSYENILSPEFEKMSYEIHSKWGGFDEFNNYEYNRRSSLASAIHKKYRDALMPEDETKDALEHKRWNAYMRSTEGYTFGFVRDDIALRHPQLVKYDNLSRAEKDKDHNVNMKFNQDETVF